jgi:hypothetical protein
MQDQSAAWAQQADPNQWNAYYGYGYDPYGYAQDPSYAYGAYAGYSQYPQQARLTLFTHDTVKCHLLVLSARSCLYWTPEACCFLIFLFICLTCHCVSVQCTFMLVPHVGYILKWRNTLYEPYSSFHYID